MVPGKPEDYRRSHPSRPVLTVEIAESSLAIDRRHKGSVVRPGWRYARVEVFDASARVSPLAKPDASVRVSDLLP